MPHTGCPFTPSPPGRFPDGAWTQNLLTIRLTPAERRTLLAWQRATTISAGLARRARIILLLADGVTITDIGRDGWPEPSPYLQVDTAVCAGRTEGLEDKPAWRRLGPLPSDLRNQHDMDVG